MNAMAGPATTGATSFTVALCTHNHAQRLYRTLEGLARLLPPTCPWDLLIVDNASTDETPRILSAPEWRPHGVDVRIVREGTLGVAHARNRAIEEATSEYIVYIDDDESPEPDWLRALEELILVQRPDALGGRIEVLLEDGRRPPWLHNELLGFLGKLDHGGIARRLNDLRTPIFTGNSAFHRRIFSRIGAFDVGLGRRGSMNTGGEDIDMYRRMISSGCNVWWAPQAMIYHRIQASKLRRSYFLDLHFRQGCIEGMRNRGNASRLPPRYLLPQLWRAFKAAASERLRKGSDASLRKEMNVAYFLGYIHGWTNGTSSVE